MNYDTWRTIEPDTPWEENPNHANERHREQRETDFLLFLLEQFRQFAGHREPWTDVLQACGAACYMGRKGLEGLLNRWPEYQFRVYGALIDFAEEFGWPQTISAIGHAMRAYEQERGSALPLGGAA